MPEAQAELVGAVLMDRLGPFAQESPPKLCRDAAAADMTGHAILTFYPEASGLPAAGEAEVRDLLGPEVRIAAESAVPAGGAGFGVENPAGGLAGSAATPVSTASVLVEVVQVSRGWEEGWKDHFHPVAIGRVRIRPPWEEPTAGVGAAPGTDTGSTGGAWLTDVVINPGMGFGTGLHPTTRGALELLQATMVPDAGCTPADVAAEAGTSGSVAAGGPAPVPGGPLVDAGTGSGILAIVAAKLGWAPVIAFDNDPVALAAAAGNVEANGVASAVQLFEADVSTAEPTWFDQATVLANMTLDPVSTLISRLAGTPAATRADTTGGRPAGEASAPPGIHRLVVSGILSGEQERRLVALSHECGFRPGRIVYEAGWVSLELLPGTDRVKES
ncbi:MAG: 50S ribosomal protein L11 methyltransferase [Actinobacteria bacterium]|nr:50S ribosomal protein L11 methyltransferase [Actinomycetota bacterium]